MTQTAVTEPIALKPLPAGWRWVRLGEVCREDRHIIEQGSAQARELPYLGLEDVESQTGKIHDGVLEKAGNGEGISTTFLFTSSHVLYGKLRPYLNKVALPQFDGRCTTEIIPLHTLEGIDREFLAWILRRNETVHFVMQEKTGSRMPRADMSVVLNMTIPLPPISVQKRITKILKEQIATVQRARAAAEAQLEAAKVLPSAYLKEIFEGPDAKSWPKKRLEELCRDISDGTHITPNYSLKGIPFLSVTNIRETGISFENCRFISKEQHAALSRRSRPERGDVLYTKVGTTGVAKAIDVDVEFSIFVSVALLKLQSGVLAEYLEKVLNSPLGRRQAEALTQGMANRNLVLQDLKRIEVPVPSLAHQRQIAANLAQKMNGSETTRRLLEEQLDALISFPGALLRRAFSGELLDAT